MKSLWLSNFKFWWHNENVGTQTNTSERVGWKQGDCWVFPSSPSPCRPWSELWPRASWLWGFRRRRRSWRWTSPGLLSQCSQSLAGDQRQRNVWLLIISAGFSLLLQSLQNYRTKRGSWNPKSSGSVCRTQEPSWLNVADRVFTWSDQWRWWYVNVFTGLKTCWQKHQLKQNVTMFGTNYQSDVRWVFFTGQTVWTCDLRHPKSRDDVSWCSYPDEWDDPRRPAWRRPEDTHRQEVMSHVYN